MAKKGGFMGNFKVLDISTHNGNIDWKKVKANGINQVIVRAGFGIDVEEDRMFKKNIREMEREGIDYGIYLYSYATSMNEAEREVRGFVNLIKGLKPTLPVVVDTEDADGWRAKNGNPSWGMLAKMLKMQLEYLESKGYYAMWYANLSWTRNLLAQVPSLKNHDLWLAQWYVDSPDNPGMPVGIWQYTEQGPKFGDRISSSDLNIAYQDYPALIKKLGLNGHKKEEIKEEVKTMKGMTVIAYKNEADFASAAAIINSRENVLLVRTSNAEIFRKQGAEVIQVGGHKIAGATKVIAGANRQATLKEVADYLNK